jgi:hypothetical protein
MAAGSFSLYSFQALSIPVLGPYRPFLIRGDKVRKIHLVWALFFIGVAGDLPAREIPVDLIKWGAALPGAAKKYFDAKKQWEKEGGDNNFSRVGGDAVRTEMIHALIRVHAIQKQFDDSYKAWRESLAELSADEKEEETNLFCMEAYENHFMKFVASLCRP